MRTSKTAMKQIATVTLRVFSSGMVSPSVLRVSGPADMMLSALRP